VQVAASLRDRGLAVHDPEIVARTGWTSDELLAALSAADLRPPYDLVSLLIGVNNQYRGWGSGSFAVDLEELLGRAVDLAGGQAGRALAISIPDWGVTPFAADCDRLAVGDEIDAFNRVFRRLARRAGCRWVDVTPLSRAAADDPRLLAADGLHPSAEMYARWTELILPEALAALALPGVGGQSVVVPEPCR
jgi:lysophospholipase L1-like esterase